MRSLSKRRRRHSRSKPTLGQGRKRGKLPRRSRPTGSRLRALFHARTGPRDRVGIVRVQGIKFREEFSFVLSELRSYGVRVDKCVYHVGKRLPNSLILINRANGSRTIVHHRDLPELTFDDFTSKIDLKDYKWIHFEGRNASHVSKMIHAIRQYNNNSSQESSKITISVEIEKTKPEIQSLLPEGDVVFISKDFSRHHGCQTASEALRHFASKTRPQAKLICAWGEEGAYATEKDAETGKISEIYESPAFPPPVVIDTLGAGDTFNATVIDCLNKGQDLQEAIVKGCKIAGKKCGQEGHKGLILHY
ncbi:ketohexokinase-like [Oscarella lobularis]|uniref:ketohexokinase-like n=1 Tax=Oscarella lobularis TaxID=121494 RepID=UPI003313B76E